MLFDHCHLQSCHGHLRRSNELRPERAKTLPPALTSEGVRGRLLPGLLAVARSNMASYYLTGDL